MTSFIEALEALGSFLIGLAGRGALFLAGALALAIPAVAIALVWRAIDRQRARALAQAGGTRYRRGAYYAPNHTWLAPRRRGELEVGIDDLAQRLLPSATSVDLPRPGMQVHRGDPIAVIHAGGRAIRVGAPVDGTILRVNPKVRRDPDLVKAEPYGRGWLFSVAPADGDYLRLPQDREADGWLRAERARLVRLVEDELGLAAADGGELLAPAPSLLGEESWRRVVQLFLHAA
jgi:glycine cleavage system H lipoate-binding protein